MSFDSHIVFPMSIEATQIFDELQKNAEIWRRAVDLRDNVQDYVKHGPPQVTTHIPPPATRTSGRHVNIMA